jgi:hypothetical protein
MRRTTTTIGHEVITETVLATKENQVASFKSPKSSIKWQSSRLCLGNKFNEKCMG